jgi:hypothetical protein
MSTSRHARDCQMSELKVFLGAGFEGLKGGRDWFRADVSRQTMAVPGLAESNAILWNVVCRSG